MAQYEVDLVERLTDILGEGIHSMDDEQKLTLTYTWNHGGEHLTLSYEGGGALDFGGTYHPNVRCEGNPCRFCGTTFYDDNMAWGE